MDKFLDQFAEIRALYKYVAVAAIIALSVGAFWYFIYQDKKLQIDKLDREIADLRKERDKAEVYAARYDEFKEELRVVDLKLKDALKKLPEDREIPNLLDRINESVIEAGLSISNFVPGSPQPQDFYSELPVQINVQGGYHNFSAFADVLSKMERIVTVKNVSFSPVSDKTGLLNISCQAVTFLQSQEQGQ